MFLTFDILKFARLKTQLVWQENVENKTISVTTRELPTLSLGG